MQKAELPDPRGAGKCSHVGWGLTDLVGVAVGVAARPGGVLHPPHVQAAVAGARGHALAVLTRRARQDAPALQSTGSKP